MNKRTTLALSALAIALLPHEATVAHHSNAEFDGCAIATIDGLIERISWASPHIVIDVNTSEEGHYLVLWVDPASLARTATRPDALEEGDRVVISAAKHRNPELQILALVSDVHRPSDGWRWTRNRERPPECGE